MIITKIGNVYVSIFLNKITTIRDKDWRGLSDYFDIPMDKKEIDKREIRTYVPLKDFFRLP
jgi:site-specific DNA-methyltransferase (adenine-specific)